MRVSEQGRELIKAWEGFVPKVYSDIGGVPTVCWGHVVRPTDEQEWGDGASLEECELALVEDLETVEACLDKAIKVAVTQGQFDALVSFAYNVGTGALRSSTLLARLNVGRYDAVPEQLRRWVNVNGKPWIGLVNRRAAECKLWSGSQLTIVPAAFDLSDLLERAKAQGAVMLQSVYNPAALGRRSEPPSGCP